MNYEKSLEKFLEESIKNIHGEVAIAFSGGLDSSLLAYLLKDKCKLKAYVVGVKDCHDFVAADSAAKMIDIPLEKIEISDKDIKYNYKDLEKILNSIKYPKGSEEFISPWRMMIAVSFNFPIYFVCKHCKESVVVSGQGPDTMLGGYSKHLILDKKDLEEELKQNTKDLVLVGKLQHEAIGRKFNKNVIFPYITDDIRNFCFNLPLKYKIDNGNRKIILVKTAKLIGLPSEIAERQKKSAQYGSGIIKILRKMK